MVPARQISCIYCGNIHFGGDNTDERIERRCEKLNGALCLSMDVSLVVTTTLRESTALILWKALALLTGFMKLGPGYNSTSKVIRARCSDSVEYCNKNSFQQIS